MEKEILKELKEINRQLAKLMKLMQKNPKTIEIKAPVADPEPIQAYVSQRTADSGGETC